MKSGRPNPPSLLFVKEWTNIKNLCLFFVKYESYENSFRCFSIATNISVLFNGPLTHIVFGFFFIACYCHKKFFSTLCSFEVSATNSNMIFDVSACFIYLQRFFLCCSHGALIYDTTDWRIQNNSAHSGI